MKKTRNEDTIYCQTFFEGIMARIKGAWGDKSLVNEYITRLLVQKMNYDEVMNSLGNKERIDNSSVLDIYRDVFLMVTGECPFEKNEIMVAVNIDDYPLLLNPWNGDRVIRNMIDINDSNVLDGLDEEKCHGNIQNLYLYPMGIVLCFGGNHSQLAALHKHKGRTVIIAAYDYARIYESVAFDGKGFYSRKKTRKKYLKKCKNDRVLFCAGILFELATNAIISFRS